MEKKRAKYRKDKMCPKCGVSPAVITKNGNRLAYCRPCKTLKSKEWLNASPDRREALYKRIYERAEANRMRRIEKRRLLLAQHKGFPKMQQLVYDAAYHLPDSDECLEWTGSRNRLGYAIIFWEGRTQPVPKIVLELVLGRKLRPNTETNHRCDNRGCYRRSHLFEASHKRNMEDAALRGRMSRTHQKGSKKYKYNARGLTNEQAMEVLKMHAEGMSLRDIHKAMPIVSANAVHAIIRNKTYKDIDRGPYGR